ncbi:hypothetical protein PR202_gb20542 [Eleusine coracana subsp. coracana]|uniref:Uncharacterized protein n=1 Tax=Eleusine coracana subsp. coracana TaxID=191504 RepID=A0AAV5F8S7_ELECO|nr:hypothetical protein PR202_gb20542 [Eleusine coracana subsp. coracana]
MLRAAARRRSALALAARSVHAQSRAPQSYGLGRQRMDPAWVPLYKRLTALSPFRPAGAVAAELDAWIRA